MAESGGLDLVPIRAATRLSRATRPFPAALSSSRADALVDALLTATDATQAADAALGGGAGAGGAAGPGGGAAGDQTVDGAKAALAALATAVLGCTDRVASLDGRAARLVVDEGLVAKLLQVFFSGLFFFSGVVQS